MITKISVLLAVVICTGLFLRDPEGVHSASRKEFVQRLSARTSDLRVCEATGLKNPMWEITSTRGGRTGKFFCADERGILVRVVAPQGCSGFRPDLCEE